MIKCAVLVDGLKVGMAKIKGPMMIGAWMKKKNIIAKRLGISVKGLTLKVEK